jgi:hypothetical protein
VASSAGSNGLGNCVVNSSASHARGHDRADALPAPVDFGDVTYGRTYREEGVHPPLAERMQSDEATATWWLDGVLDEMYQTFRSGYGLTLPGFGGFYLDER